MLSARTQGNIPSNTEVALGQGYEQCKVITTRSRTKASNDAIQVEENEQRSIEQNESPEIATPIPHATSMKDILPKDVVASSHTTASSSLNAKPNEVSKDSKADVFKALKRSDNLEECHNVNVIDAELETYWHGHYLTTESKYENFEEQKPNEVAQQEENHVLR
ncbi:hypothetical protein V6N13_005098 [Hibiscus sabdariffa]